MTYSEDGIALTKHFEGCSLTAYQDQAGVWTIGYGHTQGVTKGDICTQELADAWLETDIQAARLAIKACVDVEVSQCQFDALSDFIFNLGAWVFHSSTLLKKLNAGDYAGAADEFLRWNKVRINGVLTVSAGLTRRREAERKMFLGEDWK